MTEPRRGPCLAGLAAAAALLAWRVVEVPPMDLWRDVPAVVAVYAAYLAVGRGAKSWPGVTAALTAFLLGVYVVGQAPLALGVLGLGR